jgi:L-fuconate dehydratase
MSIWAAARSEGSELGVTINKVVARDIRFPTSRGLYGSDAVNVDPDYSAAYVVLETDGSVEGHGLAFTTGRGTEIVVAAIHAYAPLIEGQRLQTFTDDLGQFWRMLATESQLRWLGPEKGIIHLALAAIVNAVWDLYAKVEGKPMWKLLVDMEPERLVSCIDFRYIEDVMTPVDAVEILRRNASSRQEREDEMLAEGYPAYTTSAAWLGYPDDVLRTSCRTAVRAGWSTFKMKVGASLDDDLRRSRLIRDEIGPDRRLMMDANQKWGVDEAIDRIRHLADFDPWWIEEPTSPDDVLGHGRIRREIAPLRVATGEHVQNRVLFKQFMQAQAIDFCQIDACRLGGVNEVLAVILMAARFGIPVCPHAGGVGLCEYVQHLSIFDYIAVSASLEDRVLEYVDHLHEHFLDPVVVESGSYRVPIAPGYSVAMREEAIERYEFPNGAEWAASMRDLQPGTSSHD